jgi:hypothetical protein
MFAYNVDPSVFNRTAVLLCKPRIKDEETQNWNDLFCYEKPIFSTSTLEDYLQSCDLQLPFVSSKNTFSKNLHLVQRFFSMCDIIKLSFPEGQHRMEATSRPCYGYGLLQAAPLEDLSKTNLDDHVYLFRIKPKSTVNDKISATMIIPKVVSAWEPIK